MEYGWAGVEYREVDFNWYDSSVLLILIIITYYYHYYLHKEYL